MKNDISKLNERDVYSLLLFALFKMKDIKEYSTLSELAYILDMDNLLKLCQYYGGLTIKIPTVNELESMLFALMLYQLTHINGKSFPVALKQIEKKTTQLNQVKKNYSLLCQILSEYTFTEL